jgi:hypothetical protein
MPYGRVNKYDECNRQCFDGDGRFISTYTLLVHAHNIAASLRCGTVAVNRLPAMSRRILNILQELAELCIIILDQYGPQL